MNNLKKKTTKLHSKDWMYETAGAWMKNVDCNLCIVDWGPLAGRFSIEHIGRIFGFVKRLSNYPKVAMRFTRLTSNAIHRFMSFMNDHGMKIEDAAIAGHR